MQAELATRGTCMHDWAAVNGPVRDWVVGKAPLSMLISLGLVDVVHQRGEYPAAARARLPQPEVGGGGVLRAPVSPVAQSPPGTPPPHWLIEQVADVARVHIVYSTPRIRLLNRHLELVQAPLHQMDEMQRVKYLAGDDGGWQMELRLTLSKAEHQCLLDRVAAALEEWDDWIRRPIYEAWPQAALEVWARHRAVCWLELDHLRRQ